MSHRIILDQKLLQILNTNSPPVRQHDAIYSIPNEHIDLMRRVLDQGDELSDMLHQFWYLEPTKSRLAATYGLESILDDDISEVVDKPTETTFDINLDHTLVAWRRSTRDLRLCITQLSNMSGSINMFFTKCAIFVQLYGASGMMMEYVIPESSMHGYTYNSQQPYTGCQISSDCIKMLSDAKSAGMIVKINHDSTMQCKQTTDTNVITQSGHVTFDGILPNSNSLLKYITDLDIPFEDGYKSVIGDRFKDLNYISEVVHPVVSKRYADYAIVHYKSKEDTSSSMAHLDKHGATMQINDDTLVITNGSTIIEQPILEKSYSGFNLDATPPPCNLKHIVVPQSASTEVYFIISATDSRNTLGCSSLHVSSTYIVYGSMEMALVDGTDILELDDEF